GHPPFSVLTQLIKFLSTLPFPLPYVPMHTSPSSPQAFKSVRPRSPETENRAQESRPQYFKHLLTTCALHLFMLSGLAFSSTRQMSFPPASARKKRQAVHTSNSSVQVVVSRGYTSKIYHYTNGNYLGLHLNMVFSTSPLAPSNRGIRLPVSRIWMARRPCGQPPHGDCCPPCRIEAAERECLEAGQPGYVVVLLVYSLHE
ncbi:hypothetical protein C8J57DRAFT_1274871, partial [Mycena rebaudengoi]